MRQLMDEKELITYLNGKLTKDTLGRIRRQGRIPVVKFPGIRRYFYDKESIDHWLEKLLVLPQDQHNIADVTFAKLNNKV